MDASQPSGIDLGLVIGGGAIAVLGLRRGGPMGLALTALGTGAAVYGARNAASGRELPRPIRRAIEGPLDVTRAITVDRPFDDVWRFWCEPSNLSQILPRVTHIEALGDDFWRWTARFPGGEREWETDVVRNQEKRVFSWSTRPHSPFTTSGFARFLDAPGGRGTEVLLRLNYKPPFGPIGKAAGWFARTPVGLEMAAGLLHLKQMLEIGELPTIEGQTSGRDAA
jgi:uncharacterized membrane protein